MSQQGNKIILSQKKSASIFFTRITLEKNTRTGMKDCI